MKENFETRHQSAYVALSSFQTFIHQMFRRQFLRFASTLSLFSAIALPAAMARGTATTSGGVSEYRDQMYARTPQRNLHADVFVPRNVKSPPLVVYIHGGGWKVGDRRSAYAKSFTRHGFAVASIDYRFSSQAVFPAQIHDCKGAIRWLRANAAFFGYDPARIAVMGESAGAHLAVLLGTSAGVKALEGSVGGNLGHSSRVQAVVDYYGATDFHLRSRTQPSMTEVPGGTAYDLLGGPVSGNKELARLASGAHFVSRDDPPLLAIHGDADEQVLIDQSERIVDAYLKHGLDTEFLIIHGGAHAGRIYHRGDVRRTVLEFLQNRLNPGKG
jgi:acetyl esterase/lipase